MVKSYRDLMVWQRAMLLVEATYRMTDKLPRNEEFGLKSQMRRAAVSIPSNIAEGHSRNHAREFLRFIHISMGSLSELETQVELVVRLGYIGREDVTALTELCFGVGKMLHGLANSLHII